MNGFFVYFAGRISTLPCSPCFISHFWLLLHHSDGAQKNQDKNEQFNIAYDQW